MPHSQPGTGFQSIGVIADDFDVLALIAAERPGDPIEEVLRRPLHRRQRRSQVVRYLEHHLLASPRELRELEVRARERDVRLAQSLRARRDLLLQPRTRLFELSIRLAQSGRRARKAVLPEDQLVGPLVVHHPLDDEENERRGDATRRSRELGQPACV